MGHTKPPFTMQFNKEKGCFTEFRRGLLLREDQLLFADMWDRVEFHIPAAEKAAHPLPIATILMCVNLEQEKSIHRLEGRAEALLRRVVKLEADKKHKELEILRLRGQLQSLQAEVERRLAAFREEMLEIKYPLYVS